MMTERYIPKAIVYIICEGASEENYIQELNRFIEKNEINLSFTLKLMRNEWLSTQNKGGDFKSISERVEAAQKRFKKEKILVWVDKDIYLKTEKEKYKKKSKMIPNFFFSYMNFEDFLALHDDKVLKEWHAFCEKRNHFKIPLEEGQYLPRWKKIYAQYQKGELPFELNEERILTLFKNLERATRREISMKCDFGSYIKEAFQKSGFIEGSVGL